MEIRQNEACSFLSPFRFSWQVKQSYERIIFVSIWCHWFRQFPSFSSFYSDTDRLGERSQAIYLIPFSYGNFNFLLGSMNAFMPVTIVHSYLRISLNRNAPRSNHIWKQIRVAVSHSTRKMLYWRVGCWGHWADFDFTTLYPLCLLLPRCT